MAKKQTKADKEQEAAAVNAKRELFCRYYTQNTELFGNATLSYAEAFDYKLDELSREGVYEEELDEETGETRKGKLIEASEHDKAYHVCSVLSSRLLRNDDIQARITALLNELLKDNIVDSQLAKLITQDGDNTAKIAGIREYNKLRGRIIDKTQNVDRLPFGETDLSAVIATLPQERQDYFYGIIRSIIEEAELHPFENADLRAAIKKAIDALSEDQQFRCTVVEVPFGRSVQIAAKEETRVV